MRILFRVILGAGMMVAIGVAAVAIQKQGPADPVTWATIAAALAVIAAVASAWTSQRVLELQEDSQRPNPIPELMFGGGISWLSFGLPIKAGPLRIK